MKSVKVLSTLAIASQFLLGTSTISSADQSGLHPSELSIYGGLATAENPVGQSAKDLALSLDDGQSWGPVYLAGSSSHSRGYGFRSGTNSWLNCNPDTSPCPGNRPQIIRSSFTLPEQFTNVQVSIDAVVDDIGYYSLNGNQFWIGGIEARSFDLTSFAKPGNNDLDVKVVNVVGEAGINFTYRISAMTNGEILIANKLFNFGLSATPLVSGSHTINSLVTASFSDIPTGANANYEWLRDGQPINGAQSMFYRIVEEDVGKKLSFRVTLSKNSYENLSLNSIPVLVRSNLPQLNPDNGHYYQFFPFSGSWHEALRAARSKEFNGLRGHLSTITSLNENKFVTSLADGNVIFLPSHVTNRNGRSLWVWADGPEAGAPISYCDNPNNCTTPDESFSQWDSEFKQPDMQGEPILVARTSSSWLPGSPRIDNAVWGDCNLNCAQGIVVEFDPSQKTFIDDDLIQSGPNHYYQLIRERVSYSQALSRSEESYFKGIRGHLVTVESSAENSLVSQLASGSAFWLAGRDIGETSLGKRNWIWDDGPNAGKQFLSCRVPAGCVGDSVGISSWNINVSHLNGYGSWKNVLQGGGTNTWETISDCAPTIDQCPQINSYIIEYELDPKLSVINQYGDWLSLSSNIVLPGQQILVSSHFESTTGNAVLTSSGNAKNVMDSQGTNGASIKAISFATTGLKSVTLTLGKKRLSLKAWVPKVYVANRNVKLGNSFTVSVAKVPSGTNCKVISSDGRVFESVSNTSGKAIFTIPSTKIGGLVFSVFAGDLEMDSQGVTVRR